MLSLGLRLFSYGILSFFISYVAFDSYNKFTQNNFVFFDGVMYEYQKIRRYEKLKQGEGLGNRLHSALIESSANPNTGGYNALLCLLWPKALNNGKDIFLRGALGLLILFFLLDRLLFKELGSYGFYLLIFGISLSPGLVNVYYGIGSFIPDAVAIMFITSSLLSLYLFIRKASYSYLVLSAALVAFSISMRLNASVYAAFMLTPLLPLLYTFLKKLNGKRLAFTLLLMAALSLPIIIYSVPKLEWLIDYNTQLGYGRVGLKEAIVRSIQLLGGLMGLTGLILCVYFFILGLAVKRQQRHAYISFLILVNSLFTIYLIVIFWRRVPEVPHVLNACFLFFPLTFFILGALIKSKIILSPSIRVPVYLRKNAPIIPLALSSFFWSQSILKSRELTLDKFSVPRKVAVFLLEENKDKKKQTNSNYLFLFEEMLNIPFQTYLYRNGLPFSEIPNFFFFQEQLLKNTGNCPNVKLCADYYINTLSSVDIVGINLVSQSPNRVREMHPFADSVALIIEKHVLNSSKVWEESARFGSNTHGKVGVFKKIH